jgi:hypothetical protein
MQSVAGAIRKGKHQYGEMGCIRARKSVSGEEVVFRVGKEGGTAKI